jgi:hypothetical protein
MKEFFKRLTLPSPAFFVKIQNIGGALIAFSAGVKIIASQYADSAIVNFLDKYTVDIAAIGAVVVLIAKLTVIPKQPNEKL